MNGIKLTITCDRSIAEEVETELESLDAGNIHIPEDQKNFFGLADTISIVASVTSIASGIFQVWAAKKQASHARIVVTSSSAEISATAQSSERPADPPALLQSEGAPPDQNGGRD